MTRATSSVWHYPIYTKTLKTRACVCVYVGIVCYATNALSRFPRKKMMMDAMQKWNKKGDV